jgi:signal transduction histidine kinase
MGPGVALTAVLPLNDRSEELVLEVARELQPYLPEITATWRKRLSGELTVDEQTLATLERTTISTGQSYFSRRDFDGYFENLAYYGTRLAKLQVDTRLVRRALEVYDESCEPYLANLFGDHRLNALATLEMLSTTAFVAISGAYFDTRSRESQALLSILDAELVDSTLDSMLQRVLEITCTTFDAVMGIVLLRDVETDLLRTEALVGLDPTLKGEYNVILGQGLCGNIARTGEAEIVMDSASDPRILFNEFKEKAKTLWGVPLKFDGNTIGVIVIGFPKSYEWMPTERELMRAIADRSALAIDRARITQTLRERESRIAELSSHLLRAQEEERTRISRELHDETGQGLMVIRLYLDMLMTGLTAKAPKAKVKETLGVVDRTIDGIRRIISKLSPLVLQELGLFAALRKEAKDLERNKGVKTRVAIADDVGRLGKETETTIYRIVQEALHNVAKHAQANNTNISVTRKNGRVRLLVEDDGIGIFPKSNFRGNSFGLAGIKERVGMLGGEVRVVSMKGKGTRIEINIPATERESQSEISNVISNSEMLSTVTAKQGGESDTNAKNKMSTN